MSKIDSLLTKYVDSINSGLQIDINFLLDECPIEEREELKRLITMADVFKRGYRSFQVNPHKAKQLFSQLENIRLKNRLSNQDSVVNFRKGDISSEEEKKLNDKLERLFKEEYGEE